MSDQLEKVIAKKFPLKISQTVSAQSVKGVPAEKLIQKLSFSHFVELSQIDDFVKRTFYEVESQHQVPHTVTGCQLSKDHA